MLVTIDTIQKTAANFGIKLTEIEEKEVQKLIEITAPTYNNIDDAIVDAVCKVSNIGNLNNEENYEDIYSDIYEY